ncbi:hypothetical protein OTERR_15850 [Oryzomicrobium terrae]|uniref:CobW C-terminal domain-containing protein n=1 Tax=Oryzomicrobium terrae TaxID=1735038 RepID=A0A5C1E7Y3_9RHOO|nr:CobW family GTP-binding protein [Oryzomicrobium terrae]QEL65061.1 hypothetical protein OTERR_15850 [Oryzomicrobium terrae]
MLFTAAPLGAPPALPPGVSGQAPIPLTVIGGFLGAGKTSLINHLLAAPGGEPLTVLVNDFGALEIDAALIRARSGDTLSLANGCICCSMGGDLVQALLALERRPEAPRRLVVETSGVADPGKVAQIGLLAAGYRLDAVVVVVDAGAFPALLADPRLGDTVARQVKRADLLVVNKADTIGLTEQRALEKILESLAPTAPRLLTREGRVPAQVLLGEATPPVGADDANAPTAPPRPRSGPPGGAGNPGRQRVLAQPPSPRPEPAYFTLSWTYLQPLRPDRARELLDRALPARLLRGKALLNLYGDDRPWLWQRAGGRSRWERLEASPPGLAPGESRVVLISLASAADEAEAKSLLRRLGT